MTTSGGPFQKNSNLRKNPQWCIDKSQKCDQFIVNTDDLNLKPWQCQLDCLKRTLYFIVWIRYDIQYMHFNARNLIRISLEVHAQLLPFCLKFFCYQLLKNIAVLHVHQERTDIRCGTHIHANALFQRNESHMAKIISAIKSICSGNSIYHHIN